MKTKAIVATLLIAVAASADARFAWPYPRKAVSPDEIGHWIAINSNPWRQGAESELTTFADGQTRRGEASPCRRGDRTGRSKIIANQSSNALRSKHAQSHSRFVKMAIFECLR
jgi:hypothetical protein